MAQANNDKIFQMIDWQHNVHSRKCNDALPWQRGNFVSNDTFHRRKHLGTLVNSWGLFPSHDAKFTEQMFRLLKRSCQLSYRQCNSYMLPRLLLWRTKSQTWHFQTC